MLSHQMRTFRVEKTRGYSMGSQRQLNIINLPPSCETGQADTGVVFSGAAPSIKAAVVPSCTHTSSKRQLRKPKQKNTKSVNANPLFGTCGFIIYFM